MHLNVCFDGLEQTTLLLGSFVKNSKSEWPKECNIVNHPAPNTIPTNTPNDAPEKVVQFLLIFVNTSNTIINTKLINTG